MTNTFKKILTIGSAALIIGIGGVAIAGMGMGGMGYGGHSGSHMGYGTGYGGHMMDQGGYMMNGGGRYSMNGYGHMFDDDHYRDMNRYMDRYHGQADRDNTLNQKTARDNTDK